VDGNGESSRDRAETWGLAGEGAASVGAKLSLNKAAKLSFGWMLGS
jgi:hypothetical protein